MSAPNSSPTGTVAHAQQSDIGGTSFLDLPLELREMIYDLCAPKEIRRCIRLPWENKPAVTGINLLRCSKQVHTEVTQRLVIWESIWTLRFSSPSLPLQARPNIDCSLAMSCLNDLTLAKIRFLHVSFSFGIGTTPVFAVDGLGILRKLTSLEDMYINLSLCLGTADPVIKKPSEVVNSPFVIGLVVCILAHIPTCVPYVQWWLYYPGIVSSGYEPLRAVVNQYKSVRGSAYTSQQNTQAQRDIGKSLHLGKGPHFVLTTTVIID